MLGKENTKIKKIRLCHNNAIPYLSKLYIKHVNVGKRK